MASSVICQLYRHRKSSNLPKVTCNQLPSITGLYYNPENPVYLYSSVITEPYNPFERATRQIAQINLGQRLAWAPIAKDVAGSYVDPNHEHTTPLPPLLPY